MLFIVHFVLCGQITSVDLILEVYMYFKHCKFCTVNNGIICIHSFSVVLISNHYDHIISLQV